MLPTFSKNFNEGASPKEKPVEYQVPESESVDAVKPKRDVRYVLSLLIFVFAVLGTAGMYGANLYFNQKLTAIENNIATNEAVIKPNEILDLIAIDQAIRLLKEVSVLRGGHSALLDAISKIVVPGVYYTSATIALTPDQSYQVTVRGAADSLSAYIHQIREGASLGGEEVSFDDYAIQRSIDGDKTVSFTLDVSVPARAFVSLPVPEDSAVDSPETL